MLKKFIQSFAVLTIVSGVMFTTEVFAQRGGNPENFCRNGVFPRESSEYTTAFINGKKGEKINFYTDEREDCPAGKNCRLKSYLIPGNEVIVSHERGNFACVWFQPRKGSETVGWIPLEKLDLPYGLRKIEPDEWVGKWSFYENSIVISRTAAPGIYKIEGNALWKGLGGNVHVGELDGAAKFTDRELKYSEDEQDESACRVTMQLVGKYMIVADNLNCGGANVSFSGVYQRKATK
jgi:hypothetical protein